MKKDSSRQRCALHHDTIARVGKQMYPSDTLLELAAFFKVFGDHSRIRILQALAVSELCVDCIAELLGMTSSAVSHQLRILRAAKIVKFRKEGKQVFYSLDDEHVERVIQDGLEHVQEG